MTEFITDKGSKITLVDLPHNLVYNPSNTYPQHRRRKVDDDGDLLLTLNDADWINHILKCNNIEFKIVSLLRSPDGPWIYHMVSIDGDIYYYTRAMKNGNQCIIAEKIFEEIKMPKFDWTMGHFKYNGTSAVLNPMYPSYNDGEWLYSVSVGHEGQLRAAKECELKRV